MRGEDTHEPGLLLLASALQITNHATILSSHELVKHLNLAMISLKDPRLSTQVIRSSIPVERWRRGESLATPQ